MAIEADRAIDRALKLAGSPGELAKKLNVSAQRVTNWKKRDMPADMVMLTARKYGVSVESLTGDAPAQPGGAAWPMPSVPPWRWANLTDFDRGRIDGYAHALAEAAEKRSGQRTSAA